MPRDRTRQRVRQRANRKLFKGERKPGIQPPIAHFKISPFTVEQILSSALETNRKKH